MATTTPRTTAEVMTVLTALCTCPMTRSTVGALTTMTGRCGGGAAWGGGGSRGRSKLCPQ